MPGNLRCQPSLCCPAASLYALIASLSHADERQAARPLAESLAGTEAESPAITSHVSSIQPLFGNLADPGRPLAVLQPAPTPRPKLELSASQSVVPHPTGIITRPLEVCRPILTRSTTRVTRILYNSNQLALFSSPRAPLALCPCCPPGARRSACSPARGRAGLRAGPREGSFII